MNILSKKVVVALKRAVGGVNWRLLNAVNEGLCQQPRPRWTLRAGEGLSISPPCTLHRLLTS